MPALSPSWGPWAGPGRGRGLEDVLEARLEDVQHAALEGLQVVEEDEHALRLDALRLMGEHAIQRVLLWDKKDAYQ